MSFRGFIREFLFYPHVKAGLAALALAAVLLITIAGNWLTSRGAMKMERAEALLLQQRQELVLSGVEQARLIKTREKDLAELRRKLEQQAGANEIMGGLQALAEACGVRIIEQRIVSGSNGPRDTMRTQMAIEGLYPGLRRFIAEIPLHAPALTVVGSMRMKPGAIGRVVSAELELFSYVGGR